LQPMSTLLIWSLIFVASLAVLIFSAEMFIRSAERVGVALGIPPFVIGLTMVALGTSLPELITSIVAVMNNSSEIVLGNVVGSNISNICLILGFLGVLSGSLTVTYDLMKVDLPIMIGATFLLGLSIYDEKFAPYEAIIFLLGLTLYLVYFTQVERPELPEGETREKLKMKEPFLLLLSIGGLYLSADYNVSSIIEIAAELEIGTEIVALSAVAFGTSLPELIVSIVALRKKQADMAIGNIIGSNIFNIFAVVGIPALFGELAVKESILSFSYPLLMAISLLCIFIFQDRNLNRWTGGLLMLFYVFFFATLVNQA
jgi:cation:H+ antiporter